MSTYRVERAGGDVIYASDIAPSIIETDRLLYKFGDLPAVLPGDVLVVTYGTWPGVEMVLREQARAAVSAEDSQANKERDGS